MIFKDMKNSLLFSVIGFLTAVSGCQKKDSPVGPDPVTIVSNRPIVQKDMKEINGTAIDARNDVAGMLVDKNTGKGISGVAVTDGFTVVLTDENGVYQMKRNALCRRVYYTTPSGYKVALDSERHMPYFYSSIDLVSGLRYRLDFVLEPLPAPESEFSLLMISDPQCGKTAEVNRYKGETVPDIVSFFKNHPNRNVYAVTLGDIVYDSEETWEPMRKSMSNVTDGAGNYLPFFHVAGNHDHDGRLVVNSDVDSLKQFKSTEYFVKYFGPTDYSFDRGNAHVVCIDDVKVNGTSSTTQPNGIKCSYAAGFFDYKYRWLEQDLAAVRDKQNKILIICMHIQVRGTTSNHLGDMLKLMTGFKEAHIMIGHTHYLENYIHTGYKTKGGTPVYEHIHGAACGAWWRANMNIGGAPHGYGVYNISASGVKDWFYKSTGKADGYQLRVYDGNQTYSTDGSYPMNWYTNKSFTNYTAYGNAEAKGAFVAEVWNGDSANWKLEFWQGGKKVGDFKRITEKVTVMGVTAYWTNTWDACATSTTNWGPSSKGVWTYKPVSGTPASEKDWEVRAIMTTPGSGTVSTFTRNSLTVDYSEY